MPASDDGLAAARQTYLLANAANLREFQFHIDAIGAIVEADAAEMEPSGLTGEVSAVGPHLESTGLGGAQQHIAHAIGPVRADELMFAQEPTAARLAQRHRLDPSKAHSPDGESCGRPPDRSLIRNCEASRIFAPAEQIVVFRNPPMHRRIAAISRDGAAARFSSNCAAAPRCSRGRSPETHEEALLQERKKRGRACSPG
jgi:hypothetical protein